MTCSIATDPLETRLLLDGKFTASASARTFDVISPVTGRLYANVARADSSDVDAAAKAARRAFDQGPWPRMAPFFIPARTPLSPKTTERKSLSLPTHIMTKSQSLAA